LDYLLLLWLSIVVKYLNENANYLFDNQLQGFVLVGKVQELAKYRTWYLTQELVDASYFDTTNEIVEVVEQDNDYADEYEDFVE